MLEIDLLALLVGTPGLAVFVAIAFGFLIGNISLAGVQLGPVGGVLIAALALGHVGVQGVPILEAIGFSLFIYSVGLQAGPRFFAVLAADGSKYILLALVVAISGLAVAVGLTRLVDLDQGIAGGVLAGALTSTPTLIGAQNAVQAGYVRLDPGASAQTVMANISIGYAITYLFGTIGLMVMVRLLPRLTGIDLAAEAAKLSRDGGYFEEGRRPLGSPGEGQLPILRAYRVEREEIEGRSIGAVRESSGLFHAPTRLKRDGQMIDFDDSTPLRQGDLLAVIATTRGHLAFRSLVGGEVLDDDLLVDTLDTQEVLVTSADAVGRRLSELGITRRYGCFVTGVTRTQIELPADQDIQLAKGDVVTLTGTRSRLDELTARLGVVERTVHQTDLLTFAFGICAGLIVGEISIRIGDVAVGLGSAGGLLLVGILFGFLRYMHPTFGRVPPAARFVLMELGLLFFMVGVGFRAGDGIVEALLDVGPLVVVIGILVTAVPLTIGFGVGRYLLKLNPVLLLGGLAGAMTSTPALGVLNRLANSSLPSLGYAGSYTFANILLALAGTTVMML